MHVEMVFYCQVHNTIAKSKWVYLQFKKMGLPNLMGFFLFLLTLSLWILFLHTASYKNYIYYKPIFLHILCLLPIDHSILKNHNANSQPKVLSSIPRTCPCKGKRREPPPQSYPLTSSCILFHTHPHILRTHTHHSIINTLINK